MTKHLTYWMFAYSLSMFAYDNVRDLTNQNIIKGQTHVWERIDYRYVRM